MNRARIALLVGGIVATLAIPAAAQITFADLVARRWPQAGEVELTTLISDARRASLGGDSLALAAPTVGLEAGPRWTPDAGRADLGLRAELPLQAGRTARGELRACLEELAGRARRGAQAEAEAALAAALVTAWQTAEIAALRERDLGAVDIWLAAARRRVEAGADPPYESVLVAGERDRALIELAEARLARANAWGALRALADLSPEPRPLALAGLPTGTADADAHTEVSAVARAAIEARMRLSVALARTAADAAASRWSVVGQVGREGLDRLARLGFSYRLPWRGEEGAIVAGSGAAEEAARLEAARRLAGIAARLAGADAALRTPPSAGDEAALSAAERVLSAQVEEGKERATAVLPLRRQLLEAQIAWVRSRALQAAARAEIALLGEEARR